MAGQVTGRQTMTITLAGTLDVLGRVTLPEGLLPHYIPSLAAVCLDSEDHVGRILTEPEFDHLRATTRMIFLTPEQIRTRDHARGYGDIESYQDYLILSPLAARA